MESTNFERIHSTAWAGYPDDREAAAAGLMDELAERMEAEYEWLYEHDEERVAGYREAVDAFDAFAQGHADFLRAFAAVRGDFISSDREAAAFMFALEGGMDDD